jgi:hypothetical protein
MKFIDFLVLASVALTTIVATVLGAVVLKKKYINGKTQILPMNGKRKTRRN